MSRTLFHRATILFCTLFFLSTVVAIGAKADSLGEAKAKGLIGEQIDGYVGAIGGGSDMQALIDKINAKRQAKYAEIAAKRGTPTEAVAQIAGKKLIERTPSGQYVMDQNGQWVQK